MQIFKNLKMCLSFFYSSKKSLVIILIFSIIATILSAIIPSLNGNIINGILDHKFSNVIILAIVAGLFQLIQTLLNLLISKSYLNFRKELVFNIRKEACHAILNFPISTYQESGQGKILNRIKDDSKNIAVFMNNIKDSVLVAFSNFGVLVYVFYLNKIIGLYYLICVLLSLLIHYIGIKKSLKYKELSYLIIDEGTSLLSEVVKGAKDIKGLKMKDHFESASIDSFNKIGDAEYKSSMCLEYSNRICKFFESCSMGIMLLIAIFLIENNMLAVSDFIVIFMYKGTIFNFSNKFSNLMNYVGQFSLACNRIFSIIGEKKEVYGSYDLEKIDGNILFKNVDFSYKNKKILSKFDLKIDANSFVCIVGRSGMGKTTLFNLITKNYIVNGGNIYIDDVDINNLSEKCIRDNISLVVQQPYLFNMSIKENLSIIDSNFTNIKDVCDKVGLSKKIDSLPDGYDTKIGEDGAFLSGGEKQKLAIARILLKKSKILLFDEVTSNLDTKSRNEIYSLITSLKGEYTILLITHDLELCKNADRVIVMDNGKIVGDDNYLNIKLNKYYSDLLK